MAISFAALHAARESALCSKPLSGKGLHWKGSRKRSTVKPDSQRLRNGKGVDLIDLKYCK
jgi:hypothetical protein